MKLLLRIIVIIISFAYLAEADVLSPSAFTSSYVEVLQSKAPKLRIAIKGPLELQVIDAESEELTVFLDNAYSEYKLNTAKHKEVLEKYVNASLATIRNRKADVDPSKIVPIVKHRAFLNEVKQSLRERGFAADKFDELYVYEMYNNDLVILYAEDTPKNIRYLIEDDLKTMKIEKTGLKELAVNNLKSLLPRIQLYGSEGTYMIDAGGHYEASLLLFDSIWRGDQIKVDGEIIVAIPTRDILLITGNKDQKGLKTIRELAAKTFEEGPYSLTAQLFVYRDGKFIPYK